MKNPPNLFARLLHSSQSFALAWINLGNVHMQRGEYDEAFKVYNKALDSDRNLTQAWYNRGVLLFATKRYCESVRAFEEVMRIKPDDMDAQERLRVARDECEADATLLTGSLE